MDIVLATSNPHKLKEFRALFKSLKLPVELLSLRQFPDYLPPEETGKTFEENATLKALSAAKALNLWALADDSGLVVPALNGAPGIFSARYAGQEATDFDNRKKLLKEMEKLQDFQRAAFFECDLVLATPEGVKISVQGRVEGNIVEKERGNKGFGYDPLFQKYDSNKTFGELDEETKNKISHRGKALSKFLIAFEGIYRA